MVQEEFAQHVVALIKNDPDVIGLAAGGSFISGELDEFSDLDLVLITKSQVAGNRERMIAYAETFGDFLSGFTGEHVGEPRVLICLYDNPLLHVDIKFLTLAEFGERVENPVVLFERDNLLTDTIAATQAEWPPVDLQWIEDRFWTWIHYMAQKLGRGEMLEAFDGLSFLRMTVLSPLAQLKNRKMPRGVRKVESDLHPADMESLKITIARYETASIIRALENAVAMYRSLRRKIFPETIVLRERTEKRSMEYLKEIKKRLLSS
jgi:hypothetical protein